MQFAGSVSGHINREKSLLTSFISGWATERRRVIRHSRRSCCLRLAIEWPGLIIHTRRSLKQRNAACRANSVKKVQDFQGPAAPSDSLYMPYNTHRWITTRADICSRSRFIAQSGKSRKTPFLHYCAKIGWFGLWLYGIEND